MLKRTLLALAMVVIAATPAVADLLVPDQVINPPHLSQVGTIGIFGASINGNPVASPGFLGGGYASQVSIPAAVSDTIVVTFAFHWPFSTNYPVPYLGIQFQNRLEYDNSEIQILGATGAGGWTAVNFGLGPNNSKITAFGGSTRCTTLTTLSSCSTFPGTSTMIGPSGTPLKGFPNPSSGIINTAPGFGRFAVNPPITFTTPFTAPTPNGATIASGKLLPFSSTFPIMKVTLHVKSAIQDGAVDLRIPATSAFALFKLLNTSTSMVTDPFGSPMTVTVTNTFAYVGNYFTDSAVGVPLTTGPTSGGGPGAIIPNTGSFGVGIVPEPASAALMGIGLFCLVGGTWRRRRRFGEV